MFSIFFRRLQKFLLPIKILAFVCSAGTIIFTVWNIEPAVGSIALVSALGFVALLNFLSFLLPTRVSFFFALLVSFLFFLKAEGLLSGIILGVFVVFMVLLALYLRPEKHPKSQSEKISNHKEEITGWARKLKERMLSLRK